MTQNRKTAHRRKLHDALVPISAAYVRELLKEAKLSERQAVRALEKLGVHTAQATLDHIIQGRQVRCRASLRDGLASLLGAPLPPEWLAGDYMAPLAGVADLNQLARPGSSIGKRIAALRKDHGLSSDNELLEAGLGNTPRYELVLYGLIHDIKKARPHESPFDVDDFARAVGGLLSLDLWRRWLFQGPGSAAIDKHDMDSFAKAMGEAIRVALQPVLKGRRAAVRPERLKQLLAALNQARAAVLSDTAPTAMRTGGTREPRKARK